MASNTQSRWYDLMVHQTVHVKEFRELYTHPRTLNMFCVVSKLGIISAYYPLQEQYITANFMYVYGVYKISLF
jgi:hypothetical protein